MFFVSVLLATVFAQILCSLSIKTQSVDEAQLLLQSSSGDKSIQTFFKHLKITDSSFVIIFFFFVRYFLYVLMVPSKC